MTKKIKNLTETASFIITGTGRLGDLLAQFEDKEQAAKKLNIYVCTNRRIKPALESGDRFVGRLMFRKGEYWVKPVARTAMANAAEEKVFGIIEKRKEHYFLKAAEKNVRMDYLLDNIGRAATGDFVRVVLAGDKKFKQAHVVKNYGKFDLNKATAALVLDRYDIPYEFSDKINKELDECTNCRKDNRLDLTGVPLVTIDGADSKDFDDAVWAEKSALGFHLIVAIADVSYYVRPGSELDREAYKRGNSVYLPNRVIPMLPEKLSNDLCSLNPHQERACIACLMEIDRNGKLVSYDFQRAVMKSAARLTYEEVQRATEGEKSANIAPVFKSVIAPLYEAYEALDKARRKRGALNLESDEIKVKVDKNGVVQSIAKEESYTSNKVVEEFMIAANVAAALALKKSKLPVMYRVHDRPPEEKLSDFATLVHHLGLKMPDVNNLKPAHFNKVIEKCSKNTYAGGINDMILRLQSQAQYSPHNIGHFGLGLSDYVHFTSPIRRYADLLIHRALANSLKMPDADGEETATLSAFEDIGRHLCETERKAVNAERDITARFVSAYLEPAIGQDFEVKITGLTNAGMFVRIESLGAEGLIPLSTMPDDYYTLAPGNTEMSAQNSGKVFKMGQKIAVRLSEASPITGGLIFQYLDPERGAAYFEKGNRGGYLPGEMKTAAKHKGEKNNIEKKTSSHRNGRRAAGKKNNRKVQEDAEA